MERMEHFRDARLVDGATTILEHVEGYLGAHVKAHGRKQWHGYFELTNDQHVMAGAHYQLVLADGRIADINAADIRGSEVPGRQTHVVEFYVVGDLRGNRRGSLRDEVRRHSLS
jgi:hypothetical protein